MNMENGPQVNSNMTSKADFQFLGQIGKGSFGKVDKVTRTADGKVCVCKQVSLSNFTKEKEREQALTEARIMSGLSCPYLIEYMDTFLEEGTLFIILQYCERGDLMAYLKKTKTSGIPEISIWRIILRIAKGLEYLHSNHILHRDVKTENIFLTCSDEGVRVGDLGQAKLLTASQTDASTLMGSPRYLSPEEIDGVGHYNDKCDVWGLGIILYEMCSKGHKNPYCKAKNLPELMEAIMEQDVPELPDEISVAVKEVSRLLLEKNAQQRPSLAELFAMSTVIEHAKIHTVFSAPPRSESEPAGALNLPAPCEGQSVDQPQASAEVADNCCTRLLVALGLMDCRGPLDASPLITRTHHESVELEASPCGSPQDLSSQGLSASVEEVLGPRGH